ncbi:DUF3883 domain-containing protein [Achromobacter animicus]|uniref:DUF3883 domain-containing protein n=1 Tax=Achromobacter animicus TaxID=1389935 RepID=UPI0028B0492D|nr:DUF3883 domain-containing protein [Achromobacter animicus]
MSTLLPSRGTCHAVFIMGRVLLLRGVESIDEWVETARRQTSFIATASDLGTIANLMITGRLATCAQSLRPHAKLVPLLSRQADRDTLILVARLLLHSFAPPWLSSVAVGDALATEYIPHGDRDALEWLEPDLANILIDVAREKAAERNADFRLRLGNAGELTVVEAKRLQGARVTHVALISDSYGYDIEAASATGKDRELIEVKATLGGQNHCVHITRNERDKAKLYGEQWKLVLVMFDPAAFFKGQAQRSDIIAVKTLPNRELLAMTDRDSEFFRWESSAELCAPDSMWSAYPMPLPNDFRVSF